MLPYTYGYVRDATKCNIDRPYRKREQKLLKYESCMKKPECKAELEKLDQRLPAGSLPACVSPFGVYDLNGNINEWVFRPKEKPPEPERPQGRLVGPGARPLPADRRLPQGRGLRLRGGLPLLQGRLTVAPARAGAARARPGHIDCRTSRPRRRDAWESQNASRARRTRSRAR